LALMFISKLLTGILCTVDNDLLAFGCRGSSRSTNADFCFEKLPISALFPSVNYTNPKTFRADICGAPISFQQADEDPQDFLILPNGYNADDFEHGYMDGNYLQQKTSLSRPLFLLLLSQLAHPLDVGSGSRTRGAVEAQGGGTLLYHTIFANAVVSKQLGFTCAFSACFLCAPISNGCFCFFLPLSRNIFQTAKLPFCFPRRPLPLRRPH